MKKSTAWVVEPNPDGTCRCHPVTVYEDGTVDVGPRVVHSHTVILVADQREPCQVSFEPWECGEELLH